MFYDALASIETLFWTGDRVRIPVTSDVLPRGVLPNKEVGGGGLDLTSSLEAKFGARSGQVH